jgi:hypothetical protein
MHPGWQNPGQLLFFILWFDRLFYVRKLIIKNKYIISYIPHFSLVIPEFSHIEYQKHF